jgi:2-haloacid dehalogenase
MPRVFMFDAYGTLFDVKSAVDAAGGPLGPQIAGFSALWRQKQLEYTWTYSAMGFAGDPAHNFEQLTARALDFAIASFGINPPGMRDALLIAYQTLRAYPDVPPTLRELKGSGNRVAIFTNGTQGMIDAAVDAAGLRAAVDLIITVEPTGFYKPTRQVYEHARAQAGIAQLADAVFVSSNRWDIAGAAAFGFTPIWVNRSGQQSEYPGLDPIVVVPDLTGIGGI